MQFTVLCPQSDFDEPFNAAMEDLEGFIADDGFEDEEEGDPTDCSSVTSGIFYRLLTVWDTMNWHSDPLKRRFRSEM